MTDTPTPEAPRERLAANEIISRTFAVQRRGFRPDDVTRYLAQLAGYISEQHALLDRLTEERDSLKAELESLRARRDLARLDVATVTTVLGEEAAEILRSASEAAEAIRARAEAYAAEVTTRADSELAARRQELDTRQARLAEEHRTRMERADAEIEEKAAGRMAEVEEAARVKLAKATEDAAEIITKAKAVRTDVYDEIRSRTAQAKSELGELEDRRSRLAAVMHNAQAVIGELSQELAHPSPVPSFELVEQEPESEAVAQGRSTAEAGEVAAGAGESSAQAARRTLYYFNDIDGEHAAAPAATTAAAEVQVTQAEAGESEVAPEAGVSEAEAVQPGEPEEVTPEVIPAGEELSEAAEPGPEAKGGRLEPEADVPALAASTEPREDEVPEPRQTSVQGIFARLLSDTSPLEQGVQSEAVPEPVAVTKSGEAEAAEAAEPEPEATSTYSIHEDYAQTFVALQAQLARRVKRVLQDDQNQFLDGLRTTRVRDTEGLIGGVEALTERYAEVMGAFVAPVSDASAGLYSRYAESVAGDVNSLSIRTDSPSELFDSVTELAEELAGEVHGRLDRVLARHESEDEVALASNIGATFRELKTDYVELLAKDLVSSLANSWLLYGTNAKAVRWLRGPEPGCSDCEDNELAGANPSGSEFPTGILFPPAHIGCGCLLVPEFA